MNYYFNFTPNDDTINKGGWHIIAESTCAGRQNVIIYYSFVNPLVDQYDYQNMSDYTNMSSHAEVVVNTNSTTANSALYIGIAFDHPCQGATFTLEAYPVGDNIEFIYPDITYTSNVTGN